MKIILALNRRQDLIRYLYLGNNPSGRQGLMYDAQNQNKRYSCIIDICVPIIAFVLFPLDLVIYL